MVDALLRTDQTRERSSNEVKIRPRWEWLVVFSGCYILAAGFAKALAIIPGTGISIWPPSGLYVATLILAARRTWGYWIFAAFVAELTANAIWFHNPVWVASAINLGNALEAIIGASLVLHFCGWPVRFETLREVLVLVATAAGVAPLVSATVGGLTLHITEVQNFSNAFRLFWIGDATGVLIVAPLALVVIQDWPARSLPARGRWLEIGFLVSVLLVVAVLTLSGNLPFAYLIMPPLLWASVRFEFRGAVLTLAFLALITALFTVTGLSEFSGNIEDQQQRHVMLQLFLAISALSALIVAAMSRQHQVMLETLRANNQELERRVQERSRTLRESEERLRLFIENAPASIAQFDREMRYLAASHRWSHDYGLSGDIIGKRHYDLVPDTPESWKYVHQRTLMGNVLRSEGESFQRADGTQQWIKWESLPWHDSNREIGGIVIAAEDITARKAAEDALLLADQRKNEFLAMLAHELRNPLAPIRNVVHLLRWQLSSVPAVQETVDILDRQVTAMTRMIDDLMDVTRINQGKLELRKHKIELKQILQSAIETSRPLIESMAHKLVVEIPETSIEIQADETRLAQVFLNLLNNAAKYTERGGRIELRVFTQDQTVTISIKDSGIGIAVDQLPYVFLMYKQTDGAKKRAQGGLGIGLSLVKRLVELHDGTVNAASDGEGRGSTFTVDLPRA